mgnify:CR=1 FL=1
MGEGEHPAPNHGTNDNAGKANHTQFGCCIVFIYRHIFFDIKFVFDIFKGWAAVKLITFTTIPEGSELYSLIQILLILCVFLGHVFPVFFEFKGGKGVAALTGAMVAIHPYAALLSFAVFLIILAITHYTSLSVIITAISYPLFMNLLFGNLFDDDMTVTVRIFSILVAVLLPMTHLSNIKRLLSGKEEKFRLKKGV